MLEKVNAGKFLEYSSKVKFTDGKFVLFASQHGEWILHCELRLYLIISPRV